MKNRTSKTKIAVFASGTGSNAQKIIEHLERRPEQEVALVVSNRAKAPVLEMARAKGVDTLLITRGSFYQSRELLNTLDKYPIDFIVLAGFLWLVPVYLVEAYRRRMINIHPALLPKYGGKGMYGSRVHEAVIAAGEKESGITIHYVNEKYDEGDIILQARCALDPDETPQTLAEKIHRLEHTHFPLIVEKLVDELPSRQEE